MKKVVILVTMSLALAFIFIIPLTLALESCHNQGIIGDVNNDGKIDLTDGVSILNYLFRAGTAPECIEAADFNEDNSITIADAIKLFKFLFQGGPGPTNPYFRGINYPPQLGFVWVIDEERLAEEQNEIPEIKAQIPTTVLVGDISGESDIKKCSVTAIELNFVTKEPIGEAKLIFDSQWHLDPSFQGKDITKEPLGFVPKQPEITVGNKYQIDVTCTDNKDQSDTITMLLTPIAPASPPFCASPDTCCVCVEGSGCDRDPEASTRCLGAEDTNGDLIPDRPRSCNELGGPNDPPAYQGAWVENQAACTAQDQQEGEGGGGSESTIDPLTPPTGPCEVKGLTILKTGDPIPSDIPLPPEYVKITTPLSDSKTVEKLGHNEGWIVHDTNKAGTPVISYRLGYEFIVLAHLTDGSDPNSCPEGQFIQRIKTIMFYDPTTGRLSPIKSVARIPNLMYPHDNIIKFKTLEELNLVENIEEFMIETKELNEGCPFILDGSGIWCADDYLYERGGPGEKYKKWIYFIKKHKKSTTPPKILWYDNPGEILGAGTIINGPGRGYPWTRNTGNIKIEKFKNLQFNFISIVEDFGSNHRFYCKMDNLVIENDPNKATNNQKIQITEPTCKCIEQEWRGQWENKGEPKKCGIGPESFIQNV